MKIKLFLLLWVPLLFSQCDTLISHEMEIKSAPCPPYRLHIPDSIPGTNCVNPCQFIYEGTVDFFKQKVIINCQEYPLAMAPFQFRVDPKGYPIYSDHSYIPAIWIEIDSFSQLCNWDFQFQYQGKAPFFIKNFCQCGDLNTGGYRIVPKSDFWERYQTEKGHFHFLFSSEAPLIE